MEVDYRTLAQSVANAAVAEVEAPNWAQAGKPLDIRFGVSAGGGRGMSSSIGFALGPFRLGRTEFRVLDTAMVSRGGIVPAVAKGTAVSAQVLRLDLH